MVAVDLVVMAGYTGLAARVFTYRCYNTTTCPQMTDAAHLLSDTRILYDSNATYNTAPTAGIPSRPPARTNPPAANPPRRQQSKHAGQTPGVNRGEVTQR